MADLDVAGHVPLVLLPVRVEVRSTEDGTRLRVRVFHDALHSQTLDEGLSDAERAAAEAYWTAVWADGDTAAPWPELLTAVGRRRAAWVAEAVRPTNLSARPAAPPQFPMTPPPGSGRAVARTLPDRFYVRIEQDGAAPLTVEGADLPDELPVGAIGGPGDEFTALQLDDEDAPAVDESLRWLVDYAEAERVGMAVTVTLPRPGHAVRRLLVYGVRAALDPASGAERLDGLIRSHQFTDGAEFVAQGTPTNNTEAVRTSWSRRTPPGPPALDPLAGHDAYTNASVTAAALGADPARMASLAGSSAREQANAAAFNAALWTTTWGDAIEHLTPAGRTNGDRRLDSPSLDAVRDHWVDCVRGRGPLPVLRFGRQPYGLLPLVATDESWQPRGAGFVENRLVPFLDRSVRFLWEDAVAGATTVMNRPLDTALPQILGTDAVLRGLRVRTALSPDPIVAGAMALTIPDLGDQHAGAQVAKAMLLLAGVADDALDAAHLLGTKTRSLALPLVHETDQQFVTGLLQVVPPPMEHRSVLQVLLAHAWSVERHSRESVAPGDLRDLLREAVSQTEIELDRGLVTAALDSVREDGEFDARLVRAAAEHVSERVGRLDQRALADRNPVAAIAPPTVVQQVAGEQPSIDRLTGEAGVQVIGEFLHRSQWGATFRAALETIARIDSIDERRLLLAETLDCCSHRLDAWISAAATRRLHDIRSSGAQGVYVGSYGWLENIELRAPTAAGQIDGRDVLHDPGDGGYIHAPGLTHAATAAILRSGRLTHRRGDPDSEAMDIDLSSGRTRDAMALLDGVRRGQTLGALLGYRLERRLHERSGEGAELDRFIYVLRTLAPLRGGKLTEPGRPVQEGLAASDVVDGLRLMAVPTAQVLLKLQSGPDDQRYIVPPDTWLPPRAGEAEAVLAAIAELEQTHDAVADLLLAESVYQLAAGNPARAAATLDVLGAGEAAPPEPDVVRTPRTGVPIQHRIAIVIADPPSPLPGWNPDAPRALAEPRLEAWAQRLLGDPASVAVFEGAASSLADAGLSALDVLYDADGDNVAASTLAARLRAVLAMPDGDVTPLAMLWELAGMARSVAMAGRPLDVPDAGSAVAQDAVGRLPDSAELIARASAAVTGLATAIGAADPLAALVPYGIRPIGAAEPLVEQANARLTSAQALLAGAQVATSAMSAVELARQAIAAVFGSGFVALPRLLPPPPGEDDLWNDAVGAAGVRAKPGAQIRPWLARMGVLRPAASAYGELLLVREAYGDRPALRTVQSPVDAFATWVGLPFPDGAPPSRPLSTMVAETVGEDLTGAFAGIVIDEWTEVLPRRLERRDPRNPENPPELVDVTTTALAVHANGPGARPPQAILIALSPDGGRWTGSRLAHALDEAQALTRMRTLTLQQIPYVGTYLPALYFRDWSLLGEPVIDWGKVAVAYDSANLTRYLDVQE